LFKTGVSSASFFSAANNAVSATTAAVADVIIPDASCNPIMISCGPRPRVTMACADADTTAGSAAAFS
jgi:hypothetical protein